MEDEKDVYNLPIAAFTFGKNGQALPYSPIKDLKDSQNENKNKNNEPRKNISNSVESKDSKDSNNLSNDDSEKRFSFKNVLKNNTNNNNSNNNKNNIIDSKNNFNANISNNYFNINLNNNNFNYNNFVFIDKEDSNSSYLKMILYSISYMKLLNNYILNELQLNNKQKNTNKEKLLLIVRDILIKIDNIRNIDKNVNSSVNINNIINIEQLKEILSVLFKNKKKFLKNSPDDPIDFLFVIINYLHSLKAKKEQNEKHKEKCFDDCFSHKNLWINLVRIYECGCKAHSKQILNRNNYFLDIPINIIIKNFIKNNLQDINQKLFIFYKQIISNIKISLDCPKYGNKCKINKVNNRIILRNCPSYLIFNLENDYFKNISLYYPLNNILKSFILIPHIFNINSLFDSENNNKNYYELIGIIFLKISKVYTCMFKQKDIFNYYEDDIFINFNNYYDIILFSIKNGLIPISLFYQNIDLNSDKKIIDRNSLNYDKNYELTKEQIIKLEKYVKNTNSLNKNIKNKIRTNENIISDNYNINYNINSLSSQNRNNPSFSDNYNSSRFSGSVNSLSSYQKNEYICNHCERINKIENKICFFCGYNNKPFLTNIVNNSNYSNNNNFKNQRINMTSMSSHKNTIKKRISLTQGNENIEKNEELGEIEDEYKNIDPHVLKYFDMPRPYIPTKKNEVKNSPKQISPKNNKNKIPYNNSKNYIINNNIKNNNNINNNNQMNVINNSSNIINLNKPPIFGYSEPSTIENNIINNLNPKINSHRNNITHKKRNSDNNNYNNSNYYSDHNNNQLNINLKINNNNNYNIFDFSNKKNLINLENYSGYDAEGNNFNDKKILKKINILKNKKIKLNNSNNNENNNLNFNIINKSNVSDSHQNINNINFGIYFQNENWTCENCLNENSGELTSCLVCKMERNINKSNIQNNNFIDNTMKINILPEAKSKKKIKSKKI